MTSTFKTSNPVFSKKLFLNRAEASASTMTVRGTVFKSVFLLALLTISSLFVWNKFAAKDFGNVRLFLSICAPISILVGLVTPFKPQWSFITAPLYALAQGAVVGAFSSIAEMIYPGVVSQAIPLTGFVLFGMLLLYSTGVIKVTQRLKTIILVAMVSLLFTYLLEFALRFFGLGIPYIHDSGPIGIAFSGAVVVIAAFSLLLDFQFIVQSEANGMPKYMEWYCAYGLMVSLIWLYLRILELLVKASKSKR